ncbi:Phospholipase A and acyltransferase 3 [Bulinus truncatus]|nr:Phospholipase A and acyltransferase 3 [Bulinus truncatus]
MGCSESKYCEKKDSNRPGKKPCNDDQDISKYKAGDIIAFDRADKKITHYGIYNGRGVIYHVSDVNKTGKFKGKATVVEEPLNVVKGEDGSWVANDKDKEWGTPNDVQEILKRARSAVGDYKYHLITNNCEHFVMMCRYGKKYSSQTAFYEKYLPWKTFEKICKTISPNKTMDHKKEENYIQIYIETAQYMKETENKEETEESKLTRMFEKIQYLQNKINAEEDKTALTRKTKAPLEIEQVKFEV